MGCHSRKLSSTCWLGCSRRAEAGNRSTTNSETGCLPGKDIGESPSPSSSLKALRHAHSSALLCQHMPASIADVESVGRILFSEFVTTAWVQFCSPAASHFCCNASPLSITPLALCERAYSNVSLHNWATGLQATGQHPCKFVATSTQSTCAHDSLFMM